MVENRTDQNQQAIMNSLKDEGPEAWLAFLRPFEDGEPIIGLSMLAIFHHIAPKARDRLSLDWAEVAVRAMDLEARSCKGSERENALHSAMQLRSWFISKVGSRANHFVLDKGIILLWAMDGVSLSVQMAKQKAESLQDRLAELKYSYSPEYTQSVSSDLSELRRLKRRLSIVKALAECSELPTDSTMVEWLKIRELLP